MEKMKKVAIKAAPGRLISAIASMGYDQEVALCDLIDNSIDANAPNINIHLLINEDNGKTKSSIYQYIICDDGLGMDEEALLNAFTLGSDRKYPKHALGKFGIGLKSASLSLANKIIVITKTEKMDKPLCGILSRKHVEDSGNYEIDLGETPPQYENLFNEYDISRTSGTVLILDDLNEPPYSDFAGYFLRYCGIVYHLFLEENNNNLQIKLNGTIVEPIDPLFIKEAQNNGDLHPSDWSGKTPHILLSPQSLELDDGTSCEIASTQLVHPPTFEKEGKRQEIRDKYCIEQDPYTRKVRHGFYIYRNRRVIVMAELFRGIVSREVPSWAFRARLMFDETADKVMSLDVKKRHCQLPPKARTNLKSLIQPYHSRSITAWKETGNRVSNEKKANKNTIANQSISGSPVSKSDYIPAGVNIKSEADMEKRKKRQQEVSQSTLESIKDKHISKEFLEQQAKDKNIVISVKGLKSNAMWDVYASSAQIGEVEAIINEYNTWIEIAYGEAEKHPSLTILLHQFFYILARAELEVKTNDWPGFPSSKEVEKVFEKFRFQAGQFAESLADTLEDELAKLNSVKEESDESTE